MMDTQQRMERVICGYISEAPGAMYDIGVGPKTEWKTLGAAYPKMSVFGCEPLREMYPTLDDFPGRLEAVAIGEPGELELHYIANKPISASAFPEAQSFNSRKVVPCWSLDQFDESMGSEERILLWIDIEGMELAALKSGSELLKSGRVRWINLEERREGFKPSQGWCTGIEIRAVLESFGYRKILAYNKHTGHQDVIYRHEGEA